MSFGKKLKNLNLRNIIKKKPKLLLKCLKILLILRRIQGKSYKVLKGIIIIE